MLKTTGNKALNATKLVLYYTLSGAASGLVLTAVLFWSVGHWFKEDE